MVLVSNICCMRFGSVSARNRETREVFRPQVLVVTPLNEVDTKRNAVVCVLGALMGNSLRCVGLHCVGHLWRHDEDRLHDAIKTLLAQRECSPDTQQSPDQSGPAQRASRDASRMSERAREVPTTKQMPASANTMPRCAEKNNRQRSKTHSCGAHHIACARNSHEHNKYLPKTYRHQVDQVAILA